MKKKGIGNWFPILILLVMTVAAAMAGMHAAGISFGKEKTPSKSAGMAGQAGTKGSQDKEDTEITQTAPAGEEVLGVLRGVDSAGKTILVYQIGRQQEVVLSYSGATQVQTRYGTEITMMQLDMGMLIQTVCKPGTTELVSVREDEESWIYKGIGNLEIDRLDQVMDIGDQKYQYDSQITVVNQGKLVELDSLSEKDILTARGVEGKVYSLEVMKGHGILTFDNYEDFVGGSIEVGYEIFDQISTDMQYELREGSYKLIMRNGSLAVNKYITINRNETLTVDLNEYRNEVGRTGLVSFNLNPEEAEVYLDNELVDASVPVELGYGEYILEVICEGYETCSRLLSVSMPTQTIRINLADQSANYEDGILSDLNTDEEDDYHFEEEIDDPVIDDITEIDDEDTSDEIEEEPEDDYDSSLDNTDSEADDSGTESSGNEVIVDNYMMIRKPEGAEVYFDGVYVGTAPVQLDKVTGEHQITFKRSGYISKTYTIEVENDGENPVFSFPDLTQE